MEVRARTLQAEHIKQHSHYDVHKLAERAFARPDEPVRLAGQCSQREEQLLAGAVPQPSDWLRVWRAARSGSSWQAAAAHSETERFISGMRR
jgi:hypothetical protein